MKTAKLAPGEGANLPWLYRGILSALGIVVRWRWLGALAAARWGKKPRTKKASAGGTAVKKAPTTKPVGET